MALMKKKKTLLMHLIFHNSLNKLSDITISSADFKGLNSDRNGL